MSIGKSALFISKKEPSEALSSAEEEGKVEYGTWI